MKRTSQILFTVAATASAVAWTSVRADSATSEPLGEHPAIIAARVFNNAGYDYVSKMYRHPAGLALLLEAPREMGEHPAIIARRVIANAGYDYASKMYRHPAGLALLMEAPHEMGDHPAVLVARVWNKRAYDDAVRIASHPALARFPTVQTAQPGQVPDDSTVTVAKAATQRDMRPASER